MAKGGKVIGKSHSEGGEKFDVSGRLVELEDGEGVINERSMRSSKEYHVSGTPAQIASCVNELEGGVKFAGGECDIQEIMTFNEARKEAQRISKEEGVTQHVNKSNGDYIVEDWYDQTTVASYENGREFSWMGDGGSLNIRKLTEDEKRSFKKLLESKDNKTLKKFSEYERSKELEELVYDELDKRGLSLYIITYDKDGKKKSVIAEDRKGRDSILKDMKSSSSYKNVKSEKWRSGKESGKMKDGGKAYKMSTIKPIKNLEGFRRYVLKDLKLNSNKRDFKEDSKSYYTKINGSFNKGNFTEFVDMGETGSSEVRLSKKDFANPLILEAHLEEGYENGGLIPTDYGNLDSEDVWIRWNTDQRDHFLEDHFKEKYRLMTTWQDLTGREYEDLPNEIKEEIETHRVTGRYEGGGKIPDYWMQQADKEMSEHGTIGLFAEKAENHNQTPTEFAKTVLSDPDSYTLKTRQEAQFMKNANPELFKKGGKTKNTVKGKTSSGTSFERTMIGYVVGFKYHDGQEILLNKDGDWSNQHKSSKGTKTFSTEEQARRFIAKYQPMYSQSLYTRSYYSTKYMKDGGKLPTPIKITKKQKFYHVRFEDPSKYSKHRTPDWAEHAAAGIIEGSEVGMGKDKDSEKWEIQKIMIPVESGSPLKMITKKKAGEYAEEIYNKINNSKECGGMVYEDGGEIEVKYFTKRVFRNGNKSIIIEEDLTEEEAQQRVQEDIESNLDTDYYMLVYSKMEYGGMVYEDGGNLTSSLKKELVLEETKDAFSRERYGEENWREVTDWLLSEEFSETDTIIILQSKIMRWAGDYSDKIKNINLNDFKKYLEKEPRVIESLFKGKEEEDEITLKKQLEHMGYKDGLVNYEAIPYEFPDNKNLYIEINNKEKDPTIWLHVEDLETEDHLLIDITEPESRNSIIDSLNELPYSRAEGFKYGGKMKDGGLPPKTYGNRKPQGVWEAWSKDQKNHFFKDHFDKEEQEDLLKYINYKYIDLPTDIRVAVKHHVREGRYKDGGNIYTRKYKLGDQWSKDFDYKGMLKMGEQADSAWGIEVLEKLFSSYEDVNYHTESAPLYIAIQHLKGDSKTPDFYPKEPEYRDVEQALAEFRLRSGEELSRQRTMKDGGRVEKKVVSRNQIRILFQGYDKESILNMSKKDQSGIYKSVSGELYEVQYLGEFTVPSGETKQVDRWGIEQVMKDGGVTSKRPKVGDIIKLRNKNWEVRGIDKDRITLAQEGEEKASLSLSLYKLGTEIQSNINPSLTQTIMFINNVKEDFVEKAWKGDDNIIDHLSDKIIYLVSENGEGFMSRHVMIDFMNDLSENNRKILSNYIIKNH